MRLAVGGGTPSASLTTSIYAEIKMAFDGIAPEWRECKGFPKYEVSSLGEVRRAGRALKATRSDLGYLYVCIAGINGRKHKYVHGLVAEAFHGERPRGMDVDHINHQRDDNRAANLRWLSRSENLLRRVCENLGGKPPLRGTRLTEAEVMEIHRLRADGLSQKAIGERFQIPQVTVSHLLTGRLRGYLWGRAQQELGPRWHGSCDRRTKHREQFKM
jgi:hypothetical protein